MVTVVAEPFYVMPGADGAIALPGDVLSALGLDGGDRIAEITLLGPGSYRLRAVPYASIQQRAAARAGEHGTFHPDAESFLAALDED